MPDKTVYRLVTILVLISLLASACRTGGAPAPAAPSDTAGGQATSAAGGASGAPAPAQEAAATSTPAPRRATPTPTLPPLVLRTSPEPGQEIGPTDPVEIVFDQPMDRASVAGALTLSPEVNGELTWVNDAVVRFTPGRAGFVRGQRYKLNLDASARSAAGLALQRPLDLAFSALGFLEVANVQPGDEAEEVATDAVITVLFNRPVVPLSAIEDQAGLPQPLTFTPPVLGEGRWLNTAIYQFTPAEGFAPATAYTARVSAGLQDVSGNALEDDFTWTFTTVTPFVVATYPADGDIFVSPTPVISVAFNQLMDRASVEAAFSLRDSRGNEVPGDFRWAEAGLIQPRFEDSSFYDYAYDPGQGPQAAGVETVGFTPAAPLDLNQTYRVSLGRNAQGREGGGARIQAAYDFSFTTIPTFEVVSTFPADGDEQADPFGGLSITFSGPVDPASVVLGRNLIIEPTVEFSRVFTYWRDSNSRVSLSFPTGPSRRYTVTLGADIRGRYGQRLGRPQTVAWETRALSPIVFLHQPDRLATYNTLTDTVAFVTARNTSAVYFNLYRLPAAEFIRLNGDRWWTLWDDFQLGYGNLLRSWQVDIDPPLNENVIYRTHLAGEEGGALPPGLYYLEVHIPRDAVYPEAEGYGSLGRARQMLLVSKYNLTFKHGDREALVWATDLASGQPVPGLPLTVRSQEMDLIAGQTDADGLFFDSHASLEPWLPRFAFSGDPDNPGEDFAAAISNWSDGIERFHFGLNTEDYREPVNNYLYTDRSIYRPGQTVYFKGVIRLDDDAHYSLPPPGTGVEITISDSQGRELWTETLPLSQNGTLHGQIELDEEAALGPYFIQGRYEDTFFSQDFQVAEYRKPEFQVEVTTDRAEYLNGDEIELSAQASFFFGGPLAKAEVRYNILSEDHFFDFQGRGFYDFTDFDEGRARGEDFFFGFGELIEEGTGVTDAQGRFSLTLPADISQRTASQRYTLEVVVTDPASNQEVASRTTAIVHKGQFYTGLRPERYVGQVGREATVNLITVDWDSNPYPNQDLTVVVSERNWFSVKVQGDDGGFYWDSVVEDVPVLTTTATTDAQGQATISFTPERGGIFKIQASGRDPAENEVRASTFMWVSGRNFVNWRQENNDRLELVADQRSYRVGDTATLLIPHPYSGTVTALVTLERGHIYDHWVQTLETNSEQLEIPITEDMIPNMFVSVVIIKGVDEADPVPSFKLGYASLPVEAAEKALHLTLTPTPPSPPLSGGGEIGVYQPGQEVTYAVKATDAQGRPVAAELSLALVDKAVLSLADQGLGGLFNRFWRERGLGIQTSSGLVLAIDRVNLAIAPEAKGGGGGGFDESFGVIRSEFKDTALWLADFTTDENGEGQVTATLPDNLTTWTLTAVGVTGADTLAGDSRVEIVSSKPLLVRPVLPRFLVVGDRAELGVVIQNNTTEDLTLEVKADASGVEFPAEASSQSVTVPANGQRKLAWQTIAAGPESATIRFGAKSEDGLEDAVQIDLPVYHFSTPETVGTAGVMEVGQEPLRLEGVALPARYDPDQGQLTVEIDPSLAAGMRDGLDYLEHFPYECTEQTVSRFLPNVVTFRAYRALHLDRPDLAERLPGLVQTGLQRLYAQQHADGGWGWWVQDDSQPFLTAYVLLGLVEAERAGFAVEEEAVSQAIDYLEGSLRAPKDVEKAWQANQQAFILYTLAEAGAGDLGRTVALFQSRQKLDIFGRAYLALALALQEPDEPRRVETLLSDITSAAVVSATGAHWEEAQVDYFSMNTDTRSTAVIVAALSRLQPDNPLAANAVRWLMSVRQNGGHWETTQETAWAIIGLTDWMVASGELEGNYTWQVDLNGQALGQGTVDATNIDETAQLQVAVADLLAEEINRLVIQAGAEDAQGRLYYTAHLQYFKPVEEVKALARGIVVTRQYSLLDDEAGRAVSGARVGDLIQVRLTLIAPNDLHYVVVEDPFPAGAEGVDASLQTTSVVGQQPALARADRRNPWGRGYGWWWFSHTELRDEKAVLFATFLPKGTYEYTYLIRASLPGRYRVIPTQAEEMYFPEVFGRGDGGVFTITED
ncbi:MAG: Ig-like domain-containing protein [Anaerolineae bacterium]